MVSREDVGGGGLTTELEPDEGWNLPDQPLHPEIAALRREEEAAKTPEQRRAEADEAEAVAHDDAEAVAANITSVYGGVFGEEVVERLARVKRPGGEWMSASEHRARAAELRQRAERTWSAPAPHDAPAPAVVAPERQQGAREPRRNGHGRPRRARSPGRKDPDPSSPAARRCVRCGGDLSGRRPQARTCSAVCRQAVSRQERAEAVAADERLVDLLALRDVALELVRRGELDGWEALELVVWPPDALRDAARAAA